MKAHSNKPIRLELVWRDNLSSIVSFRPPRHLFLQFFFLASFCNYRNRVANK